MGRPLSSSTSTHRQHEPQAKHQPARNAPPPKPTALPWTVVAVFALALAVRAAVALHPYSGEHDPPMFGDYEAQRHWMELTLNLPPSAWYANTADNDLSYWGLDYPPLSAYLSFALGSLLRLVEPEAVALHTSRGYETPRSRAFMRLTVLFADLALFFPAVYLLARHISTSLAKKREHANAASPDDRTLATVAFCLSAPAFILVDHAHFQYNNVSLGLFALSIFSFLRWREGVAAALFCSSIFFKHMSLYYAPAVFAYLLAHALRLLRIGRVIGCVRWAAKILLCIALTSAVTFAPWLRSQDALFAVLHRLFPVARGLYEDKVANVWCSISIVLKMHRLLAPDTLFRVCAVCTAIACMPFCAAVLLKPSPARLLLACAGCALAAFLFSFQVHEKQILIPLLPLAILFHEYPLHATWLSFSAAFSLFPLLWREGSGAAYAATLLLHLVTVIALYPAQRLARDLHTWRLAAVLALVVGGALNVLQVFGTPPARFPDALVLLNTMYACAHFCVVYLSLLQLCLE